jgi:hypothetical protein
MSETASTRQAYPAQVLINLIITLLTPMFIAAAGGNLDLARAAAAETLDAYRVQSDSDLLTAALIIGFSLAALNALSRSMEDSIPLQMVLRLSGNANACNRSAQQNRKTLQQPVPEPAALPPHPSEPEFDEAEVIAAVAATKQRADENRARSSKNAPPRTQEPTEAQYQAAWASGMAQVAAEIAAEIPNLPPRQRAEATIQAAALKECANELLSGNVPPRLRPGDLAGLLHPQSR